MATHNKCYKAKPAQQTYNLLAAKWTNEFKAVKQLYEPEAIIISTITNVTKDKSLVDFNPCPACGIALLDADIERRRCLACHEFLRLYGEGVIHIVEQRKKLNVWTGCLIIPEHTIVFWYPVQNNHAIAWKPGDPNPITGV